MMAFLAVQLGTRMHPRQALSASTFEVIPFGFPPLAALPHP
jgi:hypothetical protein